MYPHAYTVPSAEIAIDELYPVSTFTILDKFDVPSLSFTLIGKLELELVLFPNCP